MAHIPAGLLLTVALLSMNIIVENNGIVATGVSTMVPLHVHMYAIFNNFTLAVVRERRVCGRL